MTISDIKLEMKYNGVDAEDIADILEACKVKGYSPDTLDEELKKRGYDAVFTYDYDDDDDDDDGWDEEEDDFSQTQQFPHKNRFDDE